MTIGIIALIILVVLITLVSSMEKGTGQKLSKSSQPSPIPTPEITGSKPSDVGDFYNRYSKDFQKVYGEVFQAFRTIDPKDLLNYEAASMGLNKDMKVLDAGCGIGGPAIHYSKTVGASVSGITISKEQVDWANKSSQAENMENPPAFMEGDYHKLSEYYEKGSFDLVYFLEAFGHAQNQHKVLDEVWEVLKPGGTLYIKDIFKKIPVLSHHSEAMAKECAKINKAYCYNIPDLNDIILYLRKKGWILSFVKTIDIPLEKFENLTISNDFQELTGIGKITNWAEYIFPVDFLEIKAQKPNISLETGDNRYFLQNMYFMQVQNWKESDL